MGFAKAIGVSDLRPSWNIPVTEEEEQFALQLVEGIEPVMIICAAASKAERNWLPKRYAAAADHMVNRGYRVILCGGPSQQERQLASDIELASEHLLENLVGKTSLTQLLAVLKHADLVLSPDTGPAHMAVTQGTPVIGLYAHSNPGRTGPYLSQDRVVSVYERAIASQFDGNVPWGTRAKGRELMQLISVEQVINSLDEFIVSGANKLS